MSRNRTFAILKVLTFSENGHEINVQNENRKKLSNLQNQAFSQLLDICFKKIFLYF
jgi:hypothetical protein